MTDPSTTIDTVLSQPAAASSDGQSATARSVGDVIAALNYQQTVAAIQKRRRGIRYTQLKNPGALDDCGRVAGLPFNGIC